MVKVNFLLLILMLGVLSSFGQHSNVYRITLRATTSVSGNEFFIDILAKEDSLKVIYKLKDSVSPLFEQDANVQETRLLLQKIKHHDPGNDTVWRYLKILDSLHVTDTRYSIDSIAVSAKEVSSYLELMENLFASQTEALENKNRYVLDGTGMQFLLMNKETARTIYARSPTHESHPLLYTLVKQTLALYRARKSNDFLTLQRTNGY